MNQFNPNIDSNNGANLPGHVSQRADTPVGPERFSPIRFLLTTIAAVFVAEIFAMNVLVPIQTLPYAVQTLIDAGIMVLLISPVLYLLSLRPLLLHIEKRRQAEHSLQQKGELQQRYFDSIDVLIAYMDRDFNFIKVNDAYASSSEGCSPEFFVGKNHFDLYPHAENRAIFQKVVETGEAFSVYEKAFEYPDQPERGVTYWNWSLQPVKAPDGMVEGVVLSLIDVTERKRAQDALHRAYERLELRVQERTQELRSANAELAEEITERKKAEEAIREREEKYHNLFSNMSEGFGLHEIILDAEGKPCDYRFLEVNDAFEKLTGISHEKAMGKTVKEILPNIETSWIEMCGKVAMTGNPIHYVSHTVSLGRWYEAYCYSPRKNQFAVLFFDVTERRQAEEQLRYQATLLSTVNDAIIASDAQYRLTAWNSAAESLYGWKAEEVLGCNGLEIIRTEWPEKDAEEMRRTIAETGRWRGEATQQRKDGTRFPAEVSSMALYDPDGQVVGYVSVNRDITERKWAEAAVRESEQRLNRAQEIAHLGSWELDLVNNRLTWSDEVYRIFGWQPQGFAATYEAFLEAVHPDDRAAVDNAYFGSLRDGRDTYEIEHRVIRHSTGETRIVHEKCEHVRDRTGEIVRSVGMVHDITERKRAEEALRESEERYRAVVESALDAIIVSDPSAGGRVLSVNPAACRMFGYSIEEFPGLARETMLDTNDPNLATILRQREQNGRAVAELTYKRRDGKRFSGEMSSVLYADKNGARRAVAIIRDITARKQMESALRQSEEKYRNLFENMTEEVHFWQLERDESGCIKTWRLVDANPPSLKTWGTSTVDEIKGKTAEEIFGPGATEHYMPVVQKIMTEGVPYSYEDYFPNLDKFFRFTSVPLGEYFITTGADITVLKKAEQALRTAHDELEQRVQERTAELAIANHELLNEIAERRAIEGQLRIQTAAMKAAANGVVITDPHGNILWTNPALTQMSGYSAEELFGQSTRIFNSGRQDLSFYRDMWSTILAGKVWKGELTNRRKDGSQYVEGQTITPVQSEDGKISHFIAVKEDITEKKQVEQDLKARNERERMLTQTIHTLQLDIARDLHDTLGQNISFLRMKLAYLSGRKIKKQGDLQLEIQTMAEAADESYDLMRGTLAILQSTDSTDLHRLFTRYTEQIEERSGFQVDFSSQGEPKPISAARMRQLFYIFREILSNIEKHAQASQVTIEMIWGADHLKLLVCDNGKGFDLNEAQFAGRYGLKFMRERVQVLNGSLDLRSARESGTSVTVMIPYETS